MMKRLAGVLTAALLCLCLLAVPAMAKEGTTGDCTWSFDENTGILTISGTGAMQRSYTTSNTPWNAYKDQITTVVIEDGVTTIGSNAFAGCSSLTSVTIPASVTTIGGSAFAGCISLTTVTYLGTTEPTVSRNVFTGTEDTTVRVPATYNGNTFAGLPVQQGGYVVTFNANGGAFSEEKTTTTVTTTDGELTAWPAEPTYPGYVFKGWFDAATGGNEIKIGSKFEEDTTVYAQ